MVHPNKQMRLYKDDTLNLELSSDDYEKLSSVCSLDELHKKFLMELKSIFAMERILKKFKV
ncbi:MAG: hypothetical protein CM15mP22_6540 [Gammaproteobacteria bacterium]|nr:MAG: hypothetical protein CM15mP22_6540 [Gammaproteobacteria bacterium]